MCYVTVDEIRLNSSNNIEGKMCSNPFLTRSKLLFRTLMNVSHKPSRAHRYRSSSSRSRDSLNVFNFLRMAIEKVENKKLSIVKGIHKNIRRSFSTLNFKRSVPQLVNNIITDPSSLRQNLLFQGEVVVWSGKLEGNSNFAQKYISCNGERQ